jgi:hypothetical protein
VGRDVVQVFEVVVQVVVQVGRASARSIADTGRGEVEGRARQRDGRAAPDVGPDDAAKGASHARERRGGGGESLLSFLGGNPPLFAVVVFPTLTMGALLIARPGLRPAFLGGGGGGGRGGGGEFCPREAPAYEECAGIALATVGVRGHLDGTFVRASTTKTTDDGVVRGGAGGTTTTTSRSWLGRGATSSPCAGVTWDTPTTKK